MKKIVCSIFVSLILFTSAWSVHAGSVASDLANALNLLRPNDEVKVVIYLSEQAALHAIRDGNRSVRKTAVVRALREKSDRTQGFLKTVLRARAKKMKSFWIVNGFAATIPASFVQELAGLPGVESIILDYPIFAPVVSHAAAALPEWNIAAVKAPDLWDLGHTGTGVVVANMDTGVDLFHPDLLGKWRGGVNSWYDPNGEHDTPFDAHGHGTSTMGIMTGGSEGGTAIGMAPDAQWIAVKLFNDLGETSLSKVHEAFQWLLDPDDDPSTDDAPDVVNASWGLLNSGGQCITDFQADIQNLKAADIAVVFSGGNSGPQLNTSESPANNAGSFAVGATDSNNLIASFSSRGPSACSGDIFPHVTAPGMNIRTADLTAGGVFPDSYAYVSGTSVAAPHVAGAIALLLSAFPGATLAEIEAALKQSASDFGAPGSDNEYGAGFINVLAAYAMLLDTSAQAVIEVSPANHDFGIVEINSESASRIFQITNAGTADLSVGSIALTGTNAADFRIVADNCSGRTIAPQATCALEAVFSPASNGSKNANLAIPSNDPDYPSVNILLTGTGFQPPLRVTSPDGGEDWAAGTTVVISWTYAGNPGYWVKIELLRAGVVNKTIASYAYIGSGGGGSYTWNIPSNQAADADYQIKVTSITDNSYLDMSNAYFEISAPPPPSIALDTPNGEERWNAGTTNTIRWTYTGNAGYAVKIELYKAGQLNRTISSYASIGSNGAGAYNWAIPSTQSSGNDYTIKIKSTANSSYADTSESFFTINGPPPPSIAVDTPNGGESWNAGTTNTIRWVYTGNPGSTVKIELYKAGQLNRTISSYASIGSNGAGAYNWAIPSTQSSGNDYTIKIKSTANSSYADTSESFFTINGPPPPSIAVDTPNGEERWSKNTRQAIRWTYTGDPGRYLMIELLKGGILNRTISSYAWTGSSGAGSYYWYIPYNQASGDDYQIRITSKTNSAVTDIGSGFFTIP